MAGSMDDRDREVNELRAVLDTLIEILVAKETLNEGHKRLFDKLRQRVGLSQRHVVQLKTEANKHSVEGPDIHCADRLHLCQARCCQLSVTLAVEDLEDGIFEWEWEEPYVLKRGADGYCLKIDSKTGGCTCYDQRPGTCRRFDCRQDRRIWIDFEKRIPAPLMDPLTGVSVTAPETGDDE